MHMYIHAYVYIYIYTCIYIHMYMSVHIHTCTYIHTHVQHVHMHACKYVWNDGAAATAREARLDAKKLSPSPCPLQSGGGSRSVASSPIARPRGTTDKRRTITANSSRESSHHHDSAPPRLQPLICTGAEPIHPVHGLPKLRATEATPLIEVAFLPFWRVFCVYENMIPAPKQSQCKQLRYTTIPVLPCVHVMSIFLKKIHWCASVAGVSALPVAYVSATVLYKTSSFLSFLGFEPWDPT